MPRKIQRSSPSSPAPQLAITDAGAAYLAIGHLGAEATRAAAQVYSATANLMATTVESLAECARAYFNYLEECERTRQVEIWSATVLAEAREHTRRIEVQAAVVLRQLDDTRESRNARMEVVRTFLGEHHRLHELFIHQSSNGLQNLSVEERVHLAKTRDEVLRRLRELETSIATITNAL